MTHFPRRFVDTHDRIDHTLLAVAAHELRHPIHLLRLALERYLPEPHDPARDAIERHVNRMARLVDDLVDFIRTERDALDLQLEWVHLDQLLNDLVDGYQPAFAQRRVQLSYVATEPGLWLDADGQRLVQIFANVLDNALKFTPAGGSVSVISARAGTASAQIRVRDTGRGIAPHRLPHVFDPPTDEDLLHGMGIGLAIAQRVAALHGGAIEMVSGGEGRGTEVIVTLPLLNAPGGNDCFKGA